MTPTSPSDKKYVIYSRKSKFTGKGESIENQIELCRGYIAAHFGGSLPRLRSSTRTRAFRVEILNGRSLKR